MPKTKIAVLRGGPSPEYEVSLKTGAHILSLLRSWEGRYEPVDIFISKGGEWHRDGIVCEPYQALGDADVAWNALHGHYGEDGRVQRVLDNLKIPYTGSDMHASARAYDKEVAKLAYKNAGLLMPRHVLFTPETFSAEKLIYVVRNYLHPVIVKPASAGSSVGVRLAHGLLELKEAIKNAFTHSKKVLVEEFVRGREATCGIIENMRGERAYALIPYGNTTQEENKKITEISKKVHEALGLKHYSSSDFIITPKGKIYILETDSLPVFHEDSRLHDSLLSTGIKPRDFVEHCVKLALAK